MELAEGGRDDGRDVADGRTALVGMFKTDDTDERDLSRDEAVGIIKRRAEGADESVVNFTGCGARDSEDRVRPAELDGCIFAREDAVGAL